MAVSKCPKCGANIPDAADFCPGCGAPKAAAQPVQPRPTPVAQPSQQPVKSGAGMHGFIETVFSKMFLTIGVGVCLLIAWICKLIMQFIDQFEISRTTGMATQTTGYTALYVLNFTFLAGAGIILLFAGILYMKYKLHVRLGLIIAGAFLLATAL